MDHEYQTVYQPLGSYAMALIIRKIQTSSLYRLDDLSHIVIKVTNKRIGYLGDESFELVDPKDESLKEHHMDLIAICDSILAKLED
ncbi:hypothetical protein J4231_03700 [Candidatus Woesearchaeota archaeon]|nr:hypothetical protein [Candidatus Woesearchaeota archaeon]